MGIHQAIGVMFLDAEGAGQARLVALFEQRAHLAAEAPVPGQHLVAFRQVECLVA
jgi:hypothetical protein